MDRSDVVKLIKKTYTKDKYGVQRETETVRTVFCQVRSVSHSEKIDNHLNGIYSTYQLSIFKYDYDGEESVEFNGKRYSVYDANEWNDFIRIYVQREEGA